MLKKILYWPLTRIVLGLVVCITCAAFKKFAMQKILSLTNLERPVSRLIEGIAVAGVSLLSYVLLYRTLEKRNIMELSTTRIVRHLLLGFLLGTGLQSLTILVMYFCGYYQVISVNSLILIISPLGMAITSAIFEEVLVRGIIFRILQESLGSIGALAISALLFGLLHIGNPGATLVVSLGLALQAGVLLGAAYMYAGNLWFPIAIHFAWNFAQSAIFGAAVSGGTIAHTLVTSEIKGNMLITGGDFGPEGSLQATIFCFGAAMILLVLCRKQGKIIRRQSRFVTQTQ